VSGRRRESIAERRERRAAIDDPAVLEAAARFLEARARSVAEVRRRLGSAGYRADLVQEAITRLTDLGMLDDATFARAWIESRDRARPRGERALSEELRLRGVDRTVIAEALDERREAIMSGGLDEGDAQPSADEAAASRLLERNARMLARIADSRARRQRAYALLARNGFDPSVCATLSERLVDTIEAATD
jgi:regulatory protein